MAACLAWRCLRAACCIGGYHGCSLLTHNGKHVLYRDGDKPRIKLSVRVCVCFSRAVDGVEEGLLVNSQDV